MGSGIFGTNILAGHGFLGFDPTPNSSVVGTVRNAQAGNFTAAPDTNYRPQTLGATTTARPAGTQQDSTVTTGSGNYAQDQAASAQASQDAQDRALALFGITSGIDNANQGLSSLDRQQQIGYGNIDRDYQSEYDILTGNRTKNNARYDQLQNDQLSQYQAKRTDNNQNAANFLTGARRTLGAQGAGGGSAARYALPFEAQSQATQANSGAQQTNAANISNILSNKQTDEDQFANASNDLTRQREQGRNDYTSQIESKRADLLSTLAQLQGQQAIANGGDFRAAQNAAAPYTSKISQLLASIDGLAATPAIQARQVTVGRPDLSAYNYARPEQAPVAQQDASLVNNNVINPYGQDDQQDPIAALFGLDPNDRRLQYA